MKRKGWIVFAMCCLLAAPAVVAAQADAPEEAREAAESWLALVEGDDYAGSWEAAARPFSGAGRVVENVLLVRDGDRGWRVAGYFLQPAG